MARIRTIKPEFWTDSFMVQLPPLARLIYVALWTCADDHGVLPDEAERLAMEVMPREDASVFDDWFQFFEATNRLESMVDESGFRFLKIRSWTAHQKVDKPSKSRIAREPSRKLAIPLETRRLVAKKYGCEPGETKEAQCFYCAAPGSIHWHRHFTGKPSAWVTFPGLELDHVEPESEGGCSSVGNIVLACRNCNRSKGTRSWIEKLCVAQGADFSAMPANIRETSWEEGKGKEQGKEQGTGKEEPNGSSRAAGAAPPADLNAKKAERLAQVTDDAVAAYNATMAKPNGLLAKVTLVNDTRRKQVKRCIGTAREICRRLYGDTTITRRFWDAYFATCDEDDFTAGRRQPSGEHANWKPDFEYLTRDAVMTKALDRALSEDAA